MYEKILQTIADNDKVVKAYGVKKIGVFGSYARGEQTAESDIDILVEFEPGKKTFDNYMDLKFFLENLFGREVELVTNEALRADIAPYVLEEVKYASE